MSKVIDINDKLPQPQKFVAHVLCVTCKHRWIGVIEARTNLTRLQCPHCSDQNSFCSIFPQEYLNAGET